MVWLTSVTRLILRVDSTLQQLDENSSTTTLIEFNEAASRPISSADGIKMRAEVNSYDLMYPAQSFVPIERWRYILL